MSSADCAHCAGLGRVALKRRPEPDRTCDCVWRAVFRACLKRYLKIHGQQQETVFPRCILERFGFRDRKGEKYAFQWGRLNEEYCADFWLVSKRHLGELDFEILRVHFLLGADYPACCRLLGIDRGHFFHAVYRVERRLGRVFAELRPYALFPVDEYFSGARSDRPPVPMPAELVEAPRPLERHPPRRGARTTAAAA